MIKQYQKSTKPNEERQYDIVAKMNTTIRLAQCSENN
jgi:hypothetical protein